MKGQTELIVAVAIILIAIIATTSIILGTETPIGKAPGDSPTTITPSNVGHIFYQEDHGTYSVYGGIKIGSQHFEFPEDISFTREKRAFIKFNLTPEQVYGLSQVTFNLERRNGGDSTNCPKLYKIADYGTLGQEDWDMLAQYITDLPCESDASVNVHVSWINEGINAFMIKADVPADEIEYTSSELYLEYQTAAVPSVPTGFNDQPGNNPGEIYLNWDSSLGAEYYEIEIAIKETGNPLTTDFNPITENPIYGTSLNYSIKLLDGTPWPQDQEVWGQWFRIRAHNATGPSAYSPINRAYPKIGEINAGDSYNEIAGQEITLNAIPPSYWSSPFLAEWQFTNNIAGCPATATGLNPTITCNQEGQTTATINFTNEDGQTTNDSTTITVQPDTTPTIIITFPENNSILKATIAIETQTQGNDITKVEFYIDDELKTEDTSAPYSYNFNSVIYSDSTHEIKVQAKDLGNNLLAENKITITIDNQAPSISITNPAEGTEVSGTTTISANPTDNTGIAGVQFKLDGTNIGTEDTTNPYNINWNTTTTSNGSHLLTATARDTAGNTTTSNPINVIINNGDTPPTPTGFNAQPGTNPGNIMLSWNQVTEATKYEIEYTREDDTETRTIFINDKTITSKNYIILFPAAKHYFKIKSCNSYGCSTLTSPAIEVYPKIGVDSDGPYNGIPSTTITLNGNTEYTATTSTYLWQLTQNNASCTLSNITQQNATINCSQEGNAKVTLTLTANNQTETSEESTVTITSEADTEDPTIEITSPTNGETISGTEIIKANATDNIEVREVNFYINNELKTTATSSPYEYSWITTTNGLYEIKAIAEDTSGNTAEKTINVTVNNIVSEGCGNGIIEGTEECELDTDCYSMYTRTTCDYNDKKYGTRTITCSSCTCSASSWDYSSTAYCSKCNACGDGILNCEETCNTCPNETGCNVPNDPPTKPTGLEIVRTTKNSITILWNPNTETDMKKYIIYSGKNSGSYPEEEIVLKNETSLTIENLDEDTKYYIAIKAVDLAENKSAYSNEVNATTDKGDEPIVPAPTGLTATQKENKIELTWNHTSPEPDNYIIQKMKKGDSYKELKTTSNNSYEDAAITKEETYYYRIQAYKNGKTSIYSNEVEIKIEKSEEPPEKDNLVQWGIGTAIIVVSAALAYVFFTFDI